VKTVSSPHGDETGPEFSEALFDHSGYLEERVFPVLMPALERLLKSVKRKDGLSEDIHDPLAWIAQAWI
jgi:hypothetical protein